MVIDVSDMNRIDVDESAGVATVQTGATQGAVVEALGKRGYTIPSGGEGTPGIGGVTLGGGIGWLARSMGLACDNLVGLEMVIASGKQGARVIHADESHNADLLWASRGGGGGNFGIATSYTFKVHPISTVTFYEATWGERDWQHLSELLSVWQELAPSAPDQLGSVFFASSKAAGTITSYGVFIGSEEERLRRLLQPLLGIGKPRLRSKPCPISMPGFESQALQKTIHRERTSSPRSGSIAPYRRRRSGPYAVSWRTPPIHGRHMVLELGCGRPGTDRRYGVLPQEAALLHRVGHLLGEGQGGEGDRRVDRAIPCGAEPLRRRVLHQRARQHHQRPRDLLRRQPCPAAGGQAQVRPR